MFKASLVFTTGFCGKTVTLKGALTFCAAQVRSCESRHKLFILTLTFAKQWIKLKEGVKANKRQVFLNALKKKKGLKSPIHSLAGSVFSETH